MGGETQKIKILLEHIERKQIFRVLSTWETDFLTQEAI